MTGGGTGGHINPALAIADTIRQKLPDAEIAFVGTPKGMENRLVPKAGYKLYHIEIQGLRRSLSPANIKTAWLTLTSVGKAKKLLREYKPDLVVGTGGYVCYPLCRAAASLGVPVAVHESNAYPGLAVRMLAPHVDIIFTNFEAASRHIKPKYRGKIIRVGNPFKAGGEVYTKARAREELDIEHKYRYSVLIFGGSLGAETINRAAAEFAGKYAGEFSDTLFTHAAGVRNYDEVKAMYAEHGELPANTELLDYIYDMPRRLAAADVAVCRSGAMTTSELAQLGVPAILVPSPNVTDDQQYKNAKVFSDAGASVLIEDSAFNAESLRGELKKLLNDRQLLRSMSEKVKTFAAFDCNDRIFDELTELTKKKTVKWKNTEK